MRKFYKGLVPICLLLCICMGLSVYALRIYWFYDRNDVEVINQLIEEAHLQIPKNVPERCDWFCTWSEKTPKKIVRLYQPDFIENRRVYETVDFSKLSGLVDLSWYTYKTKTLILPENIKSLSCEGSNIEEIDFSCAKNLKFIDCSGNNLRVLDLSGMTELEVLYCDNNQLKKLSLPDSKKLRFINCRENQLEEVLLPDSDFLEFVGCQQNQLTSLNVSHLLALKDLYCAHNQLSELDVTGLSALEYFDCSDNKITELTVQDLPNLHYLYCQNNPLRQLDIAHLPTLKMLYCSDERGRLYLNDGIEIVSFDYLSRMVTVKAESPDGKWLGGITGLPDGIELVNNTATFPMSWMVVELTPRFWEK